MKHSEIDFLQARLQRSRDVLVLLLQRLLSPAFPAESSGHLLGIQFPELGRFVRLRPAHLRAVAMMNKIVQSQSKPGGPSIGIESHDFSKCLELFGLSISR